MSIHREPGHRTDRDPGFGSSDDEQRIYDESYAGLQRVVGEPKSHEGFWSKTRNKVVAAIAGIALLGGGGAAINKLSGGSHEDNSVPPTEPGVDAPQTPGAIDKAPQTQDKLTIQDYPYEVNGKTYQGLAGLEKAAHEEGITVPGENEDGSEAFDNPKDVLKAYLKALTAWVNSGSSPEEKKKRASYVAKNGQTGVLGLGPELYDPAFESLLTTSPQEALAPNAASSADDGIQGTTQLVDKVTNFHLSALQYDNMRTTFEPHSEPNVLIALKDSNLKTATDGRVNHIAGRFDDVGIMERNVDVANGQTWTLTLWRVPNKSGSGTHWAAVNFHSDSH